MSGWGLPWPTCRSCADVAEFYGPKGGFYCRRHYVERFGTEPPETSRIQEVKR